ncbi:MAG: polysaccharide deacetylase family protein [Firmicutes bacterium]|nr:polysaccharide deacetylase family protein [Bacillota bacterium]
MKKRIFCLILSAAFLFCGCTDKTNNEVAEDVFAAEENIDNNETEENIETPTLEEYVSEIEVIPTPIREYGDSATYIHMENTLVARILYPVTDIEPLKKKMDEWMSETVDDYIRMLQGRNDDEPAELTVEYNSYLINNRYAGIKMNGIFDMPYMAHPEDVAVTFNADIKKRRVVELEDILVEDGKEILTEMTVERAGIEEDDVNKHILDNWVITHEGIEIVLERGAYLPMSEGTKTLLFTYEEMEDILENPEVWEEKGEDEIENTTEASVEIKIEEPEVEEDKPMIALTFDDGPSAHTDRLLDILEEYGGKATFFLVGNMVDKRAETVERMANEGHEIANHSWSHRQLTKLGDQELNDQIMNTRAVIYNLTEVDPVLLRPPYGSYNDEVSAKAKELGITMVNWSVDTLDWKNKDADKVYKHIMQTAADGAIVLCHDLYPTTVDAMEKAIPALIAEGYQLVTVSQLLESDGEEMEAGKMYYKK